MSFKAQHCKSQDKKEWPRPFECSTMFTTFIDFGNFIDFTDFLSQKRKIHKITPNKIVRKGLYGLFGFSVFLNPEVPPIISHLQDVSEKLSPAVHTGG